MHCCKILSQCQWHNLRPAPLIRAQSVRFWYLQNLLPLQAVVYCTIPGRAGANIKFV